MTDPATNRPPLWELIEAAAVTAILNDENQTAAELRAIAEEVSRRVELWHADAVIRWLRSEADRAEAGDAAD